MNLLMKLFGLNRSSNIMKTSVNTPLNTPLNTYRVGNRVAKGKRNVSHGSPQEFSGAVSMTSPEQLYKKYYVQALTRVYQHLQLGGKLKLDDVQRGARHVTLPVKLSNSIEVKKALDPNTLNALGLQADTDQVNGFQQAGYLHYQFELPRHMWIDYHWSDLQGEDLAIGIGEGHSIVRFYFESALESHHLVAGTTGSGKSTTMKAMQLSSMEAYTPQKIKFIIVDPNGDFDEFDNCQHLAGKRVESGNVAEIQAAFRYALREYTRRKHNKIRYDNKSVLPDDLPPRLILVVDELTGRDILKSDMRTEMLDILDSLVSEGRKFGVHLLVGTQEVTKSDLRVIDMFNNRWIGLVANARISTHLTGHTGIGCHKLTREGDFYRIRVGGQALRFQVALPGKDDYSRLKRVNNLPSFSELLSGCEEVNPASVIDDISKRSVYTEPAVDVGGRPNNNLCDDLTLAYYLYYTNAIKPKWAMANLSVKTEYHHRQYVEKARSIRQHIVGLQRNARKKR